MIPGVYCIVCQEPVDRIEARPDGGIRLRPCQHAGGIHVVMDYPKAKGTRQTPA